MKATLVFLGALAMLAFVFGFPGVLFGGVAFLPLLFTGIVFAVILIGPAFVLMDIAIALVDDEGWTYMLWFGMCIVVYSLGLYFVLHH